ncbi:MAG: right-handed parallel beta-helix repeat-containing protein [Caldisericia bacterium]
MMAQAENALTHTVFKYGGGDIGNGVLKLGDFTPVTSDFQMEYCTITDSASQGLYMHGSKPVIKNVIINGCKNENGDGIGIKMTGNADPVLEKVSFTDSDFAINNMPLEVIYG